MYKVKTTRKHSGWFIISHRFISHKKELTHVQQAKAHKKGMLTKNVIMPDQTVIHMRYNFTKQYYYDPFYLPI